MNNLSNRFSEFPENSPQGKNSLDTYIRSLPPETIAQLSQPDSEVAQVMEKNIIGILGSLPSEQFQMNVTTSRENLGRLLASAMMSGYFLNNVEQRVKLEKSLHLD